MYFTTEIKGFGCTFSFLGVLQKRMNCVTSLKTKHFQTLPEEVTLPFLFCAPNLESVDPFWVYAFKIWSTK